MATYSISQRCQFSLTLELSTCFTFFIEVSVWHYPYRLNHSYCIVGHRTTAVNIITGVAFSRVKLNWVWTGRFTLISRKEPCRTIAKAETSLANGSRIIISLIFAKVIADIIVVLGVIPFFLRRSAQLETAFVE